MSEEMEKVAPAAPRFVNADKRFEIVQLDWPLEYDGKIWDQITVRRGTIAQWRAHWESMVANTDAEFPMFDAPRAVMDALDPDDDAKVEAVMQRFFPQRYRLPEEEQTPSE